MAQNNLIRNPGFEDGAPYPTKHGVHFVYLDIWENRFWDSPVINDPNWHSTDWYKVGTFSWGTPANSGLGYIGMIDHELAQQRLKDNNQIEEGKWYEAKMFIYLPGTGPGNFSTVFDKSELKVYLAKHRMKYKKEDDKLPYTEFCKDDYKTLKTGGTQDIKKYVVVSDLTVFPIDNGWHEVSAFFIAPSPNYNWFGIEVVAKSGCQNAYVLIDDVSLHKVCVEDCENGCSRTDGEISYLHNSFVSPTMPYRIWNLDNVTSATLVISTATCELAGQAMRTITRTCQDGIGEIVWDGRKESGAQASDQTYCWDLMVENDCGSCTFYSGQVTKQGNYDPPIDDFVCNLFITPEPCCENDIYIDNVTLSGPGNIEYIAIHNIYIATNGPVTVAPDADVLFQAGNEIIVGPFDYNEELGASVSKVIVPCPNNKMAPDDESNDNWNMSATEDQKDDQFADSLLNPIRSFSIHPNPTTGQFTIQVTGDVGQGTSEVFVYDLLGNLVYKSQVPNSKSQTIDISEHGKGVYFVRVVQGGEIFTQKLIHQ